MMFQKGHVPAHKGKRTTADPLKTSATVQQIKNLLRYRPRDRALWAIATNSMLRAGDLVQLTWKHLDDDGTCITIRTLQQKTKKPITVPLTPEVSEIVREWKEHCGSPFVFSGQRGQMTVPAWSRMVKHWCKLAGFDGNFSSHTCRKTGVRVRYDEHDVKLCTLMHMLSHSSEATTLVYMGKMTDEVQKAYSTAV